MTTLLVAAAAAAFSPVPVIASLRMVRVSGGVTLAVVFAAGWILGLATVSYILLLVLDGALGSTKGQVWARLHAVLAVLLLVQAARLWWSRRRGGTAHSPAWIDELEMFTVPRAFGVAVPLAAASPRVVTFAVVAMAAMVEDDGPAADLAWFVIVGSLGVILPVLLRLARPGSDAHRVVRWLVGHNLSIAVAGLATVAVTQVIALLLTA